MGGTQEQLVRDYYDVAGPAFKTFMGRVWNHGYPGAEERGLTPEEAALELAEDLVAQGGLKAGGRALEFGSGVGGSAVHLACTTATRWVGVTNNDGLNEDARAYARERGVEDQVFFHTIADTEYRTLGAWDDASFDLVYFAESVCHLSDKAAFFRSAFRVLKPGAALVGIDWLKRPFGENRTDEQIERYVEPVEELMRLRLDTVESYSAMIADAGLHVTTAEDMWSGQQCWGSTPRDDAQGWLSYSGPRHELFNEGKAALDAARGAGVFTVGQFVATKPHSG